MQIEMSLGVPDVALFKSDQARQIVREETLGLVEASTQVFRSEIVPLTPVGATGALRAGVQTDVVGDGVNVVGRVFDPVGYAVPVEAGARPHFPPVEPLQLWVRRVLGISDEKEVRSVAFLVARAISKRGTKARDMFKGGAEAGAAKVTALSERANARIAARLMGKA